uniref:Uncharacterized protein n=1 Tax=uncultured marine microorganism HF4000_APKG8C21 TaxID=455553 RepID=B3TA41_9ZZZZ|nr:hypothetical protein ALOHA_HF4000APKG8C21ctg1g38 [uncultured marine microorganism HF4000_APKG8C21]
MGLCFSMRATTAGCISSPKGLPASTCATPRWVSRNSCSYSVFPSQSRLSSSYNGSRCCLLNIGRISIILCGNSTGPAGGWPRGGRRLLSSSLVKV